MKKQAHGSLWIMFVASRYIKKGKRSSTSTVLSILGIAVGVLALTVIIAVMNGFQLGFIESILEVSSYHIRIDNYPYQQEELYNKVRSLPDVKTAVPFKEIKGIIRVKEQFKLSRQEAVVVRGIPSDANILDEGMSDKLDFTPVKYYQGMFDLTEKKSMLLGLELADKLGVRIGSKVDFWTISSNVPLDEEFLNSDDDSSDNSEFTVTGIFRTGYMEYDLSWAFINMDDTFSVDGGNTDCVLGIKLLNRWKLDGTVSEINSILDSTLGSDYVKENNIVVTTWRDYNKTFFGALRTEKLLMFVLVGLIFIIVALNIYQAQCKAVLERAEEIGLLRSVGATVLGVRCVFMFDGIIFGALGSSFGVTLALLIITHLKKFFALIEYIVNFFIRLFPELGNNVNETYSVFSPSVFYIKEIPSRIIPGEVVMIFLFGFFSAVLAAWFASKKLASIKPSQILRYG
ncbi:MAG: ABC transporter permease [Spirochaetaceae bacterium]|jgi:lipoprotein-releasing system permease protein|nr:ABC transporter permease [Spirochaetaceae bacterium]